MFQGEAQLMTNMGPLPISFDIEAADLATAVARYADATKVGVDRAMRELQELRVLDRHPGGRRGRFAAGRSPGRREDSDSVVAGIAHSFVPA